jgi:hypothetical protein
MNWTGILTILNLVLAVGITIGGVFAYRGGKVRAEQEISERVRQLFHDENDMLQARIKRLEIDNKHLQKMMDLVIDTLKKTKGIELEITNDIVTMRDGSATHVTRLRTTDSGTLGTV